MVHPRHKLNLELNSIESSHNTLVTSIADPNSIQSFITGKNMDQKSRYNAAFRISQEISNKAKSLKQKDFEHVLSQLIKINEFLNKKLISKW